MGINISVAALAFFYLFIIWVTPIKLNMDLFIVICIFCVLITSVESIAAFAPDKPKLCAECKEKLE